MPRSELAAGPSLSSLLANGSRASQSLLFHEPWWLSATAGDQLIEASVVRGDHVSGRLSFFKTRSRLGFRKLCMPPLTHVLGPMIHSGPGKQQRRIANRLSIIRDLLDQLPPYDFCQLAIDPSLDDGLAMVDGLAFQERGFKVSPQYTFQVHCHKNLDELWTAMDLKVRQHIRRAEEKYTISEIDDARLFIDFYRGNLLKRTKNNYIDFIRFQYLFKECSIRNRGTILATILPNGTPTAMTFIAWGQDILYYMLSTRVTEVSASGSVNLLIWSAIKKAHSLGLICDLDGVISQGTARFLSGYGGQVRIRLVAKRHRNLYGAIRCVAEKFDRTANESARFS
jgi:hypothetical protein